MIPLKYLIYSRKQASVVILRGAAPPPLAGSLFSFSLSLKEKRIRSTTQDLTRKLTFRLTLGTPLTVVPKVVLPLIKKMIIFSRLYQGMISSGMSFDVSFSLHSSHEIDRFHTKVSNGPSLRPNKSFQGFFFYLACSQLEFTIQGLRPQTQFTIPIKNGKPP